MYKHITTRNGNSYLFFSFFSSRGLAIGVPLSQTPQIYFLSLIYHPYDQFRPIPDTMVNVEPQNLQIGQPQQQQQDQIQTPQHRARRTHLNDHISSFLSKLQLHDRLSMNKEIEEKNRERETKTLKHMQDPLAHESSGAGIRNCISLDY